jgi:triosephosphate isomerase (TIM)
MARSPYVIGNWKMHKTAREAADFIETVLPLVEGCQVNLFLAVPFTSILPASQAARNTRIVIGAQNMHDAREGAFTGEIASLMLKEAGAAFAILGHSERRTLFGESDEMIRRKVARALSDDLIPVLCIGETLEEREAGKMEKVLQSQIASALEGIGKEEAAKILLAYEPVWAIGTGKSATPAIAEETHAKIRSELVHLFGKQTAAHIPILYGGSVKPENTKGLMAKRDIDGLLIGGASLDPLSFAAIVKHSTEKKA